MIDIRLKPCPFCGGEVTLDKDPLWESNETTTHGYYGDYEFNIHCKKCGCSVNLYRNDTIYRPEEEAMKNAIDIWNTRASNVKKGKWIWKPRYKRDGTKTGKYIGDYNYCSICGKRGDDTFLNFCPNCGADMREEE